MSISPMYNLLVITISFVVFSLYDLKVNKVVVVRWLLFMVVAIFAWAVAYAAFSDSSVVRFLTLQDFKKATISLSACYGLILAAVFKLLQGRT